MERVLKSLMNRKQEIEQEIAEQHAILRANNIGMQEPLVDSEGFPRNDIDIFQVRAARQRIICLQNDHKDIMGQIERGLHKLHEKASQDELSESLGKHKISDSSPEPFVVVKGVEKCSPADIAGFRPRDKICRFGSLQKGNFKALSDMVGIINHSVDKEIEVEIVRDCYSLILPLKPSKWSGNGLVGWRVDTL